MLLGLAWVTGIVLFLISVAGLVSIGIFLLRVRKSTEAKKRVQSVNSQTTQDRIQGVTEAEKAERGECKMKNELKLDA